MSPSEEGLITKRLFGTWRLACDGILRRLACHAAPCNRKRSLRHPPS
jgi:hypothetical protein